MLTNYSEPQVSGLDQDLLDEVRITLQKNPSDGGKSVACRIAKSILSEHLRVQAMVLIARSQKIR